jgi:small subunit ribosomal protein S2
MSTIGIKELLEAGVHFGHQTRRWNPKMKRFIFEARNGIHVIDLSKTVVQMEEACKFLAATAAKGGNILFVGTKKQAQEAVKESAKACGQPFVTERWLGGTLTNLKTVKRSMKRMKEIERMEADGSISQYVKQEQSMIRREHQRLFKNSALRIRTIEHGHFAPLSGIGFMCVTNLLCNPTCFIVLIVGVITHDGVTSS